MNTDTGENAPRELTKIRSHQVLNRRDSDPDKPHALAWTTGDLAGIIFVYNSIKFVEDKELDKLVIKFDYTVLDIPDHLIEYDKIQFEKELGEFIIELLYYGLERDMLGFTNFKYEDVLNLAEPIDSGFTME